MTETGRLGQEHGLARASHAAGALVMTLAVAWMAWVLWRAWREHAATARGRGGLHGALNES